MKERSDLEEASKQVGLILMKLLAGTSGRALNKSFSQNTRKVKKNDDYFNGTIQTRAQFFGWSLFQATD